MKSGQLQRRMTVMDALITGNRISVDHDGSFKVEREVDPDSLRRHSSLLALQKPVDSITEPLIPECYVEQTDVRLSHALKRLPAICPLFRLQGGIPPAQKVDRAWFALMAEVKTRWNKIFPDEKIGIVTWYAAGKPRSSFYRAHTPRPENPVLFRTYDYSLPYQRVERCPRGSLDRAEGRMALRR
jgi:hypothetical protein